MVELQHFNLTREDPKTENSLPLADRLARAGDPDFLRQARPINAEKTAVPTLAA